MATEEYNQGYAKGFIEGGGKALSLNLTRVKAGYILARFLKGKTRIKTKDITNLFKRRGYKTYENKPLTGGAQFSALLRLLIKRGWIKKYSQRYWEVTK